MKHKIAYNETVVEWLKTPRSLPESQKNNVLHSSVTKTLKTIENTTGNFSSGDNFSLPQILRKILETIDFTGFMRDGSSQQKVVKSVLRVTDLSQVNRLPEDFRILKIFHHMTVNR